MAHPERGHDHRAQRINGRDRDIKLSRNHEYRHAKTNDPKLDRASKDRAGGSRSEKLRRLIGKRRRDDEPGDENAEFLDDEDFREGARACPLRLRSKQVLRSCGHSATPPPVRSRSGRRPQFGRSRPTLLSFSDQPPRPESTTGWNSAALSLLTSSVPVS